MLVVACGRPVYGHGREAGVRECHDERAHGIGDRETDVAEQRTVEIVDALRPVRVAGRGHLAQHERMAAHGTLAENDEAAREEIGTLHGDRHRQRLVAAREIVPRSQADPLAAVHVHRVVRNLPPHFCHVVLEHRGRHGRLLAAVDRARGHRACGIHRVGEADHACDHRFHALESADRHVELAPDACVGARRPARRLRPSGRVRGKGDAAPHGQLLNQHAPAGSRHLRAPDDHVERNEDVLALDGAVLERNVDGEVPPSDRHAGGVARDQRARDADVGLAAEQLVRVEHAEGKADDGGDRRQRDVALVEVQPQPEDFPALPHSAAHDARVGNRGRIGARARARQREAGNLLAAREARQVVVLLLLRPIVIEQLGGAQRVGHGHRGGGGRAAAGDLAQHTRVRVCREFQAAVPLRNDHREEALRLQELPHVHGQVAELVRDVPVVEHPAQLLARPVDEALLFGGQARRLGCEQLRPLRRSREQLPVPPDGPRLQGLTLRLRHPGQQSQVGPHERAGDEQLAQGSDIQQPQRGQQHPQEPFPHSRRRALLSQNGVGGE